METQIDGYILLRRAARTKLALLGVTSNPASTDFEIVSSLRTNLGLEAIPDWEMFAEDAGQIFRGHLSAALEASGVQFVEPPSDEQLARALTIG